MVHAFILIHYQHISLRDAVERTDECMTNGLLDISRASEYQSPPRQFEWSDQTRTRASLGQSVLRQVGAIGKIQLPSCPRIVHVTMWRMKIVIVNLDRTRFQNSKCFEWAAHH